MSEYPCYCQNSGLSLPNINICIYPDDVIVLGRFSAVRWKVSYGWFSYDGNRKICGWSLSQVDNPEVVKPIQDTDLYDVYTIESE